MCFEREIRYFLRLLPELLTTLLCSGYIVKKGSHHFKVTSKSRVWVFFFGYAPGYPFLEQLAVNIEQDLNICIKPALALYAIIALLGLL